MSSHKSPHLTFELLSDEDVDRFSINSKREIQFILQAIAKQGSQVALYYGNRENFILTTLVDADRGGFWLDAGQNEKTNERIAQSKKFYFVSVHQNVKVQFEAHQIETDLYDGMETFYMPLPHTLLRIQRRDHFRLSTPITNPLQCSILLTSPPPGGYREFPIADISSGGISLLCGENNADLEEGKSYPDCQIFLPDDDMTIEVTIQVRNMFLVTKANGEIVKRVGCKFIGLDGKTEMVLQRYINQLQLQQHALK